MVLMKMTALAVGFTYATNVYAATRIETEITTEIGTVCTTLQLLGADHQPPELAQTVRDCIALDRFDDAMQIFMAMSAFGAFDQQRVSGAAGHVVLKELSTSIFNGQPVNVMDNLRKVITRLRDHDGAFFQATCAGIQQAGPPAYQPEYMIVRGDYTEQTVPGYWQVADFDPDAIWQKTLSELNKCPAY